MKPTASYLSTVKCVNIVTVLEIVIAAKTKKI